MTTSAERGRAAGLKAIGDINAIISGIADGLGDDPVARAIARGIVSRHLTDATGEDPIVEVLRRERRADVQAMRDSGMTYEAIGEVLGMSRVRVRQLLNQDREGQTQSRGPRGGVRALPTPEAVDDSATPSAEAVA